MVPQLFVSILLFLITGFSCLHLAAQHGHSAIVAYLIAKGQDVDLPDSSGMTALMWASSNIFGYAFPTTCYCRQHFHCIAFCVVRTECCDILVFNIF